MSINKESIIKYLNAKQQYYIGLVNIISTNDEDFSTRNMLMIKAKAIDNLIEELSDDDIFREMYQLFIKKGLIKDETN